MINRNMGCIEISTLLMNIVMVIRINRNMGCIEISVDFRF